MSKTQPESSLELVNKSQSRNKRIKKRKGQGKDKINILSSLRLEGSKIDDRVPYVKRKLASLIVRGKRYSHIRKELGCTQKTLDFFLEHPDIQDAIQAMEQEMYGAGEREYQHLFLDTISRTRTILSKGSTEEALKAIEMVWKAHGRLSTGKSDGTTIYNNPMAVGIGQGTNIEDRTDAGSVLQWLKEQRQIVQEPIEVGPGVEE